MDLEKRGERLGLFKRDDEVVDNERLGTKGDVDTGSVLMQRQKHINEDRKMKEEQKEEERRLEAEDGVEMNVKKRRSRELSPWAAAKVAEYGVFPNYTQLHFPTLIFLKTRLALNAAAT